MAAAAGAAAALFAKGSKLWVATGKVGIEPLHPDPTGEHDENDQWCQYQLSHQRLPDPRNP
jgi:hypothetical protein